MTRPDRRKPGNANTRDRVDEIKDVVNFVKRAVWVFGFVVVASILITLHLNDNRVDQINNERYTNSRDACNNTTAESKLGRALVIKVVPDIMQDETTAKLVQERYPILSREQCDSRARRLVPNAR